MNNQNIWLISNHKSYNLLCNIITCIEINMMSSIKLHRIHVASTCRQALSMVGGVEVDPGQWIPYPHLRV